MALPPGIAGTKRPFDLPPASSVSNIDAIIVDDGINVRKATATQVVANAVTFASQAQAEAGVDQTTYMNPLRTAEAIAAQAVLPATLSSNAGAGLIGTTSGQTVQDVLNGISGSSTVMPVSTDYTVDVADAAKYIRIGDVLALTVTVPTDAVGGFMGWLEWNFRAVGDVSFAPDVGVTINPPNGGTLDLEDAMTVTLKRVGVDEFDLIGQTVQA